MFMIYLGNFVVGPYCSLTTIYFTHVLIVRYPYFSLENDFNGCEGLSMSGAMFLCKKKVFPSP